MSNDFVSQQLSIPSGDMSQPEPTYSQVDSAVNIQMGIGGPMSNTYASHQCALPNQHMQFVDPMSYIPGTQNLTVSNYSLLPSMEPIVNSMGSHRQIPAQNGGQTNATLSNMGSQKVIHPNKRKAAEPMANSTVPQQLSMPNKRVAHMEQFSISPEFPNHSVANRKTGPIQSMSGASGSQTPTQNKKIGKNEPTSNKYRTQRALTPKGRNVQNEAPRKAQTETFGAVRSKMRESLASALALVGQNQNTTPKQETTSQHNIDKKLESPPQDLRLAESASTPANVLENPKGTISSKEVSSGDNSNSSFSAFAENGTQEGIDNLPDAWKNGGQDSLYSTVVTDGDASFADSFFAKDELLQGHGLSWEWEINMEEMDVKEVKAATQHVGGDGEGQNVRRPEDVALKTKGNEVQAGNHVGVGRIDSCESLRSPEKLAFEIEAELFKLFDGVNKKYKEKGRSLMFNLKDRNNPELRERVMSGEISPEKLCSMTAEELASKELSEWRTAKAEELAQMIVLPDSDGDRRRLVKKTHKGEYQVEMEQDDGASVEVSFGSTALTKFLLKDKEIVTPSSSETDELKDSKNVDSRKGNLESLDTSYSLTIPADGTDLMQGLIEDEFKDTEFLPPIVSLDEFMESLNAEPPFDNLAVDAGQIKTSLEKVTSETAGDRPGSSNLSSKDADTRTGKKVETDGKVTKQDAIEKSRDYLEEHKQSTLDITASAEHVWEGALQLHISALVTVIGLYRSGEKTSTKEWPSSLEIKGRVRLDAFEKFLQELPMSRSRAVMKYRVPFSHWWQLTFVRGYPETYSINVVKQIIYEARDRFATIVVHFVLKPEASGDDRASLREVIDSYVLDERLGFVEPASGMELYLCPPHPKILDLLGKHLSKDQTEIISSTDNGLIGVVVWRKAHLSSTISPNSTSHHKHGSKKQQNIVSRRQEKNTNANVNMTSRMTQPSLRPGPLPTNDDDDIPPGFGPGAVREEDDLPEFNFSGNSNPTKRTKIAPQPSKMTSLNPLQAPRPVDQIRELIQKYGQSGESESPKTWQDKRPGIQSWKDDDEEDIPEWRPDVQPPQLHLPVHNFQQPMQPYMGNQLTPQHVLPQQIAVPPINMVQSNPSWQQAGGRWVAQQQPQGFQPGSLGSQLNVGSFPGGTVSHAGQPPGNWRRDVPGSRGF